ncbi:MAG: hypothetical protein ACREOF_20575 [Gemmatimonadales bacterium]
MLASGACTPQPPEQILIITGTDYAFQMPDTVRAGRAVIHFVNQGKVPHELVLARLKAGVTLDQVLERMRQGAEPDELLDGMGGVLIATPGDSSFGRLVVELSPGRTYGMICNFQDAPDQPPHVALGMVASFQVK